jgi:hypothetical protein
MPTILDVTSRLATLARLLRTAAPDPATVADHAQAVVAAARDLAPWTHVGAVLNAVRATVIVLIHPDADIAHSSAWAEVVQGLQHLLCDVSGTPR